MSQPTVFVAVSPQAAPTPTTLPALTVLVAPEDDPTGAALDPILAGLTADSGFRFEHRRELPIDLAEAKVNVAVIVRPADGLASVAEAWPTVQFVSFGVRGLSPSANLTVVEPLSDRLDDVGFLGGYMAALVSQDWRVASISRPEAADGATIRIAFANGAEYMCGLCRTSRPPYPGFPADYPSPTPGDDQTLQATLAQIERDDVEIAFLQPEAYPLGLIDGLAGMGVRLIGVGEQGPDPSPAWIATVESDPAKALTSVWSGVSTGEGQGSMQIPLRVSVIDASRLTPGRLLQLQAIVDDLEMGFIATGVDPLTGDPE